MKRLTITTIAILFSATTIFADRSSFRDRSDNWLQPTHTETTSGGLRDGSGPPKIGDGTNPTDPTNPDVTVSNGSIGGSLALLFGLGLSYGAIVLAKRRRQLA